MVSVEPLKKTAQGWNLEDGWSRYRPNWSLKRSDFITESPSNREWDSDNGFCGSIKKDRQRLVLEGWHKSLTSIVLSNVTYEKILIGDCRGLNLLMNHDRIKNRDKDNGFGRAREKDNLRLEFGRPSQVANVTLFFVAKRS